MDIFREQPESEAGRGAYIMVYTSNQSTDDTDVFFDDMSVLHTSGPIVRVDDYYPYGLTYNTSQLSGVLTNKYLYNGKEFQDELSLNLYDYEVRMYDACIGRWIVVDGMSEKFYNWSPYKYAKDNPLLYLDPDGLWDVSVHLYKNREQYGYGVAIVTDRNGNEVYRFNLRAEGETGHNRMKENADMPLGVYDIPDNNPWITGGDRGATGPNARLNMVGVSGEIMNSKRTLIRIHGGGQEVLDKKSQTWIPLTNPTLGKTLGCGRALDSDRLHLNKQLKI